MRWTSYKGCAMMTAGEIAKLVSVLALITACVFYSLSYGMHKNEAIVIGVVQMICIAVCIAAAASSVISMLSKKNTKPAMIRYAFDTVGNTLAVFAMVYFEMYRFWGC